MGILDRLSSQSGDRTETANKRAAVRVLKQPELLDEIAGGLASSDPKLAGDCAEVMTLVAAEKPELVAMYADALVAQLSHKDTRVRWEVTHSLADIAAHHPSKVRSILPTLAATIKRDKSVIVRDYAIQALGEYGHTSAAAAREVWPYLREALTLWDGRHAGKALEAISKLDDSDDALRMQARDAAQGFRDHPSARVRTLAERLAK